MKRLIALYLVLIGCLLSNGCSGVHNSLRPSAKSSHWNMFNRNTAEHKDSKKKKKELPPENMVVIWKDAILEKAGAPAVSGFGARIYFHDSDNQAIKAEGELVVYGFDDSSEVPNRSRQPSKKFVFTNEQFQTHYSETDLGASYSVWIPWEKYNGQRKTISLVAVFKTADGKIINGDFSTNVIPGDSPEDTGIEIVTGKKQPTANHRQIAQAGFTAGKSDMAQTTQAVMNEDLASSSMMNSTTINLTPSMASLLSTPVAHPSVANRPGSSNLKTFQPGENSVKPAQHHSEPVPATEPQPSSPSPNQEHQTGKPRKKPAVFGVPGSFR